MADVITENINKKFDEQIVFSDFSCVFKNGKITAVIGESGCGKSTLLRIIAGLDKNYTGEISGVGENISFVFQEDRLLDWLNVVENIEFSVLDTSYYNNVKSEINFLIDQVGLREHVHKKPNQLSGGMQRRVALLRAIIYKADLLLLDEPFKGLDLTMKMDIAKKIIAYVKEHKITAIIVTHDRDIIDLTDEIIKL